MWDAATGQRFSQYTEHQKRAWSVDFSLADPMMFASGSDDCSVKLWSINEACFLLYHSMSGPIVSSISWHQLAKLFSHSFPCAPPQVHIWRSRK